MEHGKFIPQNWKPQVVGEGTPFPFLVVDNWYNEEEKEKVWKELDFISTPSREQTLRAETTIVAKDSETKEPLSKAYRYYLEDYYGKRSVSPILNCMYKQRTPEFKKVLDPSTMV